MPEETQRATRLRPEEIVARSFQTPLPVETNSADSWSPRARRLFFAGIALAGAILVTVGLLFTGELSPAGNPTPLESGPGASGLTGTLPLGAEQTPATPAPTPSPTTAASPKPRTVSSVAPAPSQSTDPAAPPPSAPTVAPNKQTTTPPRSAPATTVPCTLLGSKELGAQIPPLCR